MISTASTMDPVATNELGRGPLARAALITTLAGAASLCAAQGAAAPASPAKQALVQKALQFAPDDPFIIDSLAWVEFRSGNLAESLALLQKAFTARPDAEIAAHLGEVLWVSGKRDQALAIWREGMALNADNAVSFIALPMILAGAPSTMHRPALSRITRSAIRAVRVRSWRVTTIPHPSVLARDRSRWRVSS